jgi:transposase
VERHEAEAIYDAGREVVVEVLLRMDRQIQRLTGRVEKLERELRKSSRNSSQPPSQDRPAKKPPPKPKGRSGRKQGAQPGHEGRGRELLPTSAVDEVIVHWPSSCGCGHVFAEGERVPVGDLVRHQVEELPEIATRVIEHQCPRVFCPDCGAKPRAELPAEIAGSMFGPRFQAAVVTLSVRNRISRRDVVEPFEQLFRARISTGTVDAILARAGDALEDPYEDLLRRVVGIATREGSLVVVRPDHVGIDDRRSRRPLEVLIGPAVLLELVSARRLAAAWIRIESAGDAGGGDHGARGT